jgi:hypothetical protein
LKSKCSSTVKSGEKESLKFLFGKRGVHFSAKKCCGNVQKVTPKRDAGGRVSLANVMPIFYIKGSIMKYPCIAMCKATIAKVIKDGV